jgi:alkylhydroperoxidase family enzyme
VYGVKQQAQLRVSASNGSMYCIRDERQTERDFDLRTRSKFQNILGSLLAEYMHD